MDFHTNGTDTSWLCNNDVACGTVPTLNAVVEDKLGNLRGLSAPRLSRDDHLSTTKISKGVDRRINQGP
jgi:hypothetical protein